MNSKQEARMGMYLAVVDYCSKNNSIVSGIPALQTKITEFTQKVEALRDTAKSHALDISGITENKEAARMKLVDTTFILCNALKALAKAKADHELRKKVNYSYYKLKVMRDTEMLGLAEVMKAMTTEHASEMATYGITAARITEHDDAVVHYREELMKPKQAKDLRKQNTSDMAKMFNTINELLSNELDALVLTLFRQEPAFVTGYQAARDTEGNPTYTTRTGGTVTKADQTPAAGAKVELLESGTDAVKYSTTTDADGTFSIKGLKTGVYDVKVQYNGNPEPTVVKGVTIQRRKANKISVEV